MKEHGWPTNHLLFYHRSRHREDAHGRPVHPGAVILTCDSAAGYLHSVNEALHVAGAAQQAGYPDVIAATMPLRDESAVSVVTALYGELNTDPDTIHATAPSILHQAVNHLKHDARTGPDPLS